MTELVIHAGVHKTATTHLQAMLRRFEGKLNDAGVSYLDPKQIRQNGQDIADHLQLETGDPADAIAQLAQGRRRLLISEENILRMPHQMSTKKARQLYARGHWHLRSLAFLNPSQKMTVAISVRDYASFFRSLYTQALLGGFFTSFDEFIGLSSYDVCGWPDLISRIHHLDAVERIVVWRYEEYGDLTRHIVRELVGVDIPIAPKKTGTPHVGLSAKAVDVLMAHQAKDPGENRRKHKIPRRPIAEAARQQFPTGQDYPKYDPWLPAELRASRQRYEADMETIAAMSKVEVLKA
ncbi:hypothetical protein [Nereida sp. MMG025]|uniref:hypothetical protein n=1 Tax=Nereida sp. MMG025 TaxID=2909981 RepID=UPI001F15F267|nr:hypothetical protein [Nereida sp. MMG025]MCF6445929.1 hypothetical protein [Nereida sp. MMG025]